MQASAVFDGRRLGPEWPPFAVGTDHPRAHSVEWCPPKASPAQSSTAVPRCVSPILVLLAAASILEGYKWLNVIPAGGWQPSAVVFVGLVFPVAMVLTRPRRDGRRVVAAKVVAVASLALLAVTVLAIFVDRPSVTHLMGVSDLLFALTALGAVLANELHASGSPREGRRLPSLRVGRPRGAEATTARERKGRPALP